MKLFPTQDHVIVEPVKAKEKTMGGIILPDGTQRGVLRGKVREVGPGRLLDNGTLTPVRLDKGSEVFYGEYAGTEIDLDGDKVRVLREAEVLAVVGE